MFVAKQHLVSKTAAVRVDQRNLATPLAGQVVTSGFGGKGVIELDAVGIIRLHTVNQDNVVHIDVQRETRANHQDVIAEPAGELFKGVHHFRFAMREAQQQVFLMLTELFFQRVEITGGLVNVFLGANDPDTARRLAQQRLRNHIRAVVKFIHGLQNGLTAGFLYATRPTQHSRYRGFRHPGKT